MNVHHLELFYYVARYRGISAAVSNIPYGIQQPAVSGQMRQLEDDVGEKLFERSPFRLTPAGQKLFAYVQPFFENLGALAKEMRAGAEPELRVGGPDFVLRQHLPVAIRRVRTRYPRIRLSLHTGFQSQIEAWLSEGKLDFAITPIDARPPARLRSVPLLCFPIVLLVPKASPIRSAAELWAGRKKLAEPLVGQPAGTSIMRGFQRSLKRRKVTWPQTIEAASAEMVTHYVAHGQGFGVNVAIPELIRHRNVRVLELAGFEPMTIGAVWRGEPTPLLRAVIEETQQYSKATWPKWAVASGGAPHRCRA
jgi:DNA-binding transcriptional LysR family regulator